MKRTSRSGAGAERGTTLIETVAALGLFAISIAAIGNFLVQQVRQSSNNNVVSVAYTVAEQELEGLRAMDYADIASRSSAVTKGGTTYNIATNVINDQPAPNMKKIAVGVYWTGPAGGGNVAVETIYTAVKR